MKENPKPIEMIPARGTAVTNAERKYLSEFAVNLFSARWLVIPVSDLALDAKMDSDTAETSSRCHIYLICRRPATSFDPTNFSYQNNRISGQLVYRIAGTRHEVPFDLPFELSDGAVAVRVSPYPHREIQTFAPNGEVVRYVPARMLSIVGAVNEPALKALDVLYVGQAYAQGKRTAIDRLRSHATLQKILADMQQNMPDDEVLILAFEYADYRVIASIDGTAKNAIDGDDDAKRFRSIVDNPLTQHQQICLIEAGLIRFFQPSYNEIYKNSFPYEDQKILNQCYELDFCALIVEIDTEDLDLSLYSARASAKRHHIGKFDLIDPKARRSFFAFVNKEGKAISMNDVIAPSG